MSTGAVAYAGLALAGTLGYLVGALVGWGIGRWGGRPLLERRGRWLHLDADKLDRAERWFARRGRAAVFWGRVTPVVRSFISYPAGALQSPLGSYTALTLAGSAVWCFAFAGAGWALGTRYERVHHAFTGVEVVIVAVILAALGWVAVRYRRRVRT
jgi:membrane protein DedA with SNARE-associated domain